MSESPFAFAQPQCAICMTVVANEEPSTACPSCRAPYHAECWTENGGCAIYGCALVPKTENLKPLEIPPAFWGRDEKDCPHCGAKIAAMALRCRHCGTAFASAQPEKKTQFQQRQVRQARAPMLKQSAIVLLIFACVPLLSIIAAIGGGAFFSSNREEIRKLPGSVEGLYKIGIGVAIVHSALVVLGLLAYMVAGSPK